MKKISIIVPVYNVEKYLDECLSSLVNQKCSDYEIIVINDGSSDNSKKIIDKFVNKYPELIKAFDKTNGGLSDARNYGINKASGKYLLFVDSDDSLTNNALEILEKNINDNDILFFNMNNKINEEIIPINNIIFDEPDNIKRYLISSVSACNKLIKKDLLIKNNLSFTKGIYYEDLMLIPSLVKYTNKIGYISNHIYNYYVREDSIMNKSKFNNRMLDIFSIMDNLYNNLYDDYKEELEFIYTEHFLRCAGIRFLDFKKYNYLNNISKIMRERFPNWNKNKYYKKNFTFKQKMMCILIYNKKYKLINILRSR